MAKSLNAQPVCQLNQGQEIDWHSEQVELCLNPRWPAEDLHNLQNLAQKASTQKNLKAHVWVATSGSTASSYSEIKLVALSKQAFLNSAAAVNSHLQATAQDIWAQVLPLFHVGGLGVQVRAQLLKAKVVAALSDGKWDAQVYLQTLLAHQCTLGALVPTQIYDLVQTGQPCPPSVRAIVVGGGALAPELYKAARQLGWPLLPSYGMTETCSQIATASLADLQSEDKNFTHMPDMILLPHAQAQQNEQGFLQIKATSLLSFYAQRQHGHEVVWDPRHEGWFTCEDKGQVLGNKVLIAGRGQDFLKVSGENTSLSRLREKMTQVSGAFAQEWALFAIENDRLGYEIILALSQKISQTESERWLADYAQLVLPFEKIRRVIFVDKIPRTELGKIIYSQLHDKAKGKI